MFQPVDGEVSEGEQTDIRSDLVTMLLLSRQGLPTNQPV